MCGVVWGRPTGQEKARESGSDGGPVGVLCLAWQWQRPPCEPWLVVEGEVLRLYSRSLFNVMLYCIVSEVLKN